MHLLRYNMFVGDVNKVVAIFEDARQAASERASQPQTYAIKAESAEDMVWHPVMLTPQR